MASYKLCWPGSGGDILVIVSTWANLACVKNCSLSTFQSTNHLKIFREKNISFNCCLRTWLSGTKKKAWRLAEWVSAPWKRIPERVVKTLKKCHIPDAPDGSEDINDLELKSGSEELDTDCENNLGKPSPICFAYISLCACTGVMYKKTLWEI